ERPFASLVGGSLAVGEKGEAARADPELDASELNLLAGGIHEYDGLAGLGRRIGRRGERRGNQERRPTDPSKTHENPRRTSGMCCQGQSIVGPIAPPSKRNVILFAVTPLCQSSFF